MNKVEIGIKCMVIGNKDLWNGINRKYKFLILNEQFSSKTGNKANSIYTKENIKLFIRPIRRHR